MKKLIVLGNSGLAKEVAQLARLVLKREVELIGEDRDEWLLSQDWPADLVIGIGRPTIKLQVLAKYLHSKRFSFPNLIHPSVVIDRNAISMGLGNVITAGCIFTCDITIGDFNLFNLQTTVGHDAKIGSFNVLNPSVNVSGNVIIGDQVLCGTGSQILEGLKIGNDCQIGAGAVVTKDVADGLTVVGVPAKARL